MCGVHGEYKIPCTYTVKNVTKTGNFSIKYIIIGLAPSIVYDLNCGSFIVFIFNVANITN